MDELKLPREEAEEYVEEVDSENYEEYAYMIMKSLRGSWSNPQKRIHILEYLVGDDWHEGEDIFNEEIREEMKNRIEIFKRDYFDGWHDGRVFRNLYQSLDIELGEEAARELYRYIPNDMTWGEFKFKKLEKKE